MRFFFSPIFLCIAVCFSVRAESDTLDTNTAADTAGGAEVLDTVWQDTCSKDSSESAGGAEYSGGVLDSAHSEMDSLISDSISSSDSLQTDIDTTDSTKTTEGTKVVQGIDSTGSLPADTLSSISYMSSDSTFGNVENDSDSLSSWESGSNDDHALSGRSFVSKVKHWMITNAVLTKLHSYRMHIALLIISMGVIILTLVFFLKGREKGRFLTTTRLSVMDKEVQRACRYLEKNYADPDLSVEKICEDLVTGPAFLQALFERELGMGVEEFLYHVRTNRAMLLAKENPAMETDEIVLACGFQNSRQFEKYLTKVNGISLEQFRQSFQNA